MSRFFICLSILGLCMGASSLHASDGGFSAAHGGFGAAFDDLGQEKKVGVLALLVVGLTQQSSKLDQAVGELKQRVDAWRQTFVGFTERLTRLEQAVPRAADKALVDHEKVIDAIKEESPYVYYAAVGVTALFCLDLGYRYIPKMYRWVRGDKKASIQSNVIQS